jgi:hypothetical protein
MCPCRGDAFRAAQRRGRSGGTRSSLLYFF